MDNSIIVVTHKPYDITKKRPYHPIIVGKGEFQIEGAWRDNSEENIASKNPFYCELTALYWFWKNQMKNYKYVGLCHYRRMFSVSMFSNKEKNLLDEKTIEKDLENHDIILPTKFNWRIPVEKMYYVTGQGLKKDYELTRKAIEELYPDYLNEFDRVSEQKSASYCNMFIMDAQKADEYCKWLFDILAYVEERVDMAGYSDQEKRIYGYLSEILMNVWVYKNNLSIKYRPIAYMEMSPIQQTKVNIKNKLLKIL